MPSTRVSRPAHLLLFLSLLQGGCAAFPNLPPAPSPVPGRPPPAPIPPPVLAPPVADADGGRRYSISLDRPAPLRELLTRLAGDAGIDIDIHPQLQGQVSLHAIRQPLPRILDRLAEQADMRWRHDRDTLVVEPDTPYLHHYTLDYVNISRHFQSTLNVDANISGGAAPVAASSNPQDNGSSTRIGSHAGNDFWHSLTRHLAVLLQADPDAAAGDSRLPAPPGMSRTPGAPPAGRPADPWSRPPDDGEGGKLAVHPETGLISVRATARQHRQVRTLLERVHRRAMRQVLIEATIVEVELSNHYQSGIAWDRLFDHFRLIGNFPSGAGSPGASLIWKGADLSAALRLLETFGRTRVLSSPKLMALNNQVAILKVVRDVPYFSIRVTRDYVGSRSRDGATPSYTYESKVHTVPEGIVLSVVPQIGASGRISLSVRPTITHITGYVPDPALQMMEARVESRVPEVQVRELESTLGLQSGEVGILGGLIQDRLMHDNRGLPWLARIPYLGVLFGSRDERTVKTELVVFIKPTLAGDPAALLEASR